MDLDMFIHQVEPETIPTSKYQQWSMVLFFCEIFSTDYIYYRVLFMPGAGPLIQMEGVMRSPMHCDILEKHMLSHAPDKMGKKTRRSLFRIG